MAKQTKAPTSETEKTKRPKRHYKPRKKSIQDIVKIKIM